MSYEEKPFFNMIAAYTIPGRILGDSTNPHGMPWGHSLKKDLKHFAELTAGNTLIVGAKTLPYVKRLRGSLNRKVVVVNGRAGRLINTDCIVEPTLYDALCLVHRNPELYGEPFVAGGAATYEEALRNLRIESQHAMGVHALFYATEIHGDYVGDVVMPELGDGWLELTRSPQVPDVPGGPAYDFVTYGYDNGS